MEASKIIDEKKLEKDFSTTLKAIQKVKIAAPKGTHQYKMAEDFLDMAKRYYDDAKHFMEKGDYVRALGALYYAHGWLDAGARSGLFDVSHDSELFTVD
ncbi:MAG: DUF357 domain-containing protein [Candidatus Woesearchaeota archaeon]|nr:DUF357 domain-containing protein [Candidatus Woesearchaeota archaeon]